MPAIFTHFDLKIPEPTFASPLTDLIIELDHLRKKQIGGTTHPRIFFQMKKIFHLLESIGSARIEGNNTTIAEYVEHKIQPEAERHGGEGITEIENAEAAMDFIDEVIDENAVIDKAIIFELHKRTVNGLSAEGDRTPGCFRKSNVSISGSSHKPPDYVQVPDYMEELISFINHADSHKYDLLKTAAAHHRFAWIHPFHNGNGRVVRLLTYAMLIKQGFNIKRGRIINPTAVFCINRNNYYAMLSQADSGSAEGMLAWCEYVLHGLYEEIIKIDRLMDYAFLAEKILVPAVEFCCERGSLNKQERDILKVAVAKVVFQSADIEHLMPGKIPAERSRVLARLRNEGLIEPLEEKARKYMANFTGSCLLRGVIKVLMKENFTAMRD